MSGPNPGESTDADEALVTDGQVPEQEARLERAEQVQVAAQQAQLMALRVIFMLLNVVHLLDQQDEASGDRRGADRTRRELAEARLSQARSARDEAEKLMVQGHAQAEQARRLLNRPGQARVPADEPPPIAGALTTEECDEYLEQSRDLLAQIWDALDRARDHLEVDPADDRPAMETDQEQHSDDTPEGTEPNAEAKSSESVTGCVVGALVVMTFLGLIIFAIVNQTANGETKTMAPSWTSDGTRPIQIPAPKKRRNQGKSTALAYRLTAWQTFRTTFAIPPMEQVWLVGGARFFTGFLDFRPDGDCAAGSGLTWTIGSANGRLALGKVKTFEYLKVHNPFTLSAYLDAPAPCGGSLRLSYPRISNYG
ncbi:hypothetical protein [Actinomadura rubrisoli]|uniref:Uncharacterized protein n=1 Tax=Actinomadura rubrisoli TaxID=2530368 RepID=A0A4R5B644_9ACTN|nr:hypothetical protein [Actinomadura rubrisoli]TDD80775.1 hypothetical protein E1298_25260 [Actinomadura rubrisoli]